MEQEQFKIEVVPMRNKLAGCARRLLSDPDDVEDVIQEVFLKLWCIREKLEEYDSVEAVAMQITRHLCLNHLKAFQFSRREHLSEQFGLSETTMPDVQLEEKDSVDRVMRIIDQLPGLQQLVLRMKHVEGREVEERSRPHEPFAGKKKGKRIIFLM